MEESANERGGGSNGEWIDGESLVAMSNDWVLTGPWCAATAARSSAGPATREIPRNGNAETHAEKVTVTSPNRFQGSERQVRGWAERVVDSTAQLQEIDPLDLIVMEP